MNKKKENKSEANEPPVTYNKLWALRFFSSFEEAEEADAKEMAALNPVQHLQNATALIERIYAEELKKPISKKLHFEKPEDK